MISPFILYHSMNFTKLADGIYKSHTKKYRITWDIPGFELCQLKDHISIKLRNKSHELRFGNHAFCATANNKGIQVVHPNILPVGEYSIEDIEFIYNILSDLGSYTMYLNK